jgi:glycosyltransferase involved in cell wall biosynthesis
MNKRVSIIIPVKKLNDYIHESLKHILELEYDNFEVLIFTDEYEKNPFDANIVKIIPSGKVGPAEKRDMAIKYATGEIFAFLDDDAYPRSDWLKNAVLEFTVDEVGAVGGPAITAVNDSLMQRAGGKVYESILCSGNYTYRYIPGKRKEDDDIPSVNLIVKTDVFEAVGGYDSNYYPGEDTKLCLDITKKLNKKIIYTPEVLVYHHRRALFLPHLRQISNYAKHRGYFVKKLPQTSFRIPYFLPSLFFLGVLTGPIFCALFPFLWFAYASILAAYFLLAGWSVKKPDSVKFLLICVIGIFATHIWYGIFFIKGLLGKKLIK